MTTTKRGKGREGGTKNRGQGMKSVKDSVILLCEKGSEMRRVKYGAEKKHNNIPARSAFFCLCSSLYLSFFILCRPPYTHGEGMGVVQNISTA